MPYGITCNLGPSSGDFPAFTPAKAGTWFSDPGGYKAELTWVVVNPKIIVYPPKTVTYLRNKRAVSWLESCKSETVMVTCKF